MKNTLNRFGINNSFRELLKNLSNVTFRLFQFLSISLFVIIILSIIDAWYHLKGLPSVHLQRGSFYFDKSDSTLQFSIIGKSNKLKVKNNKLSSSSYLNLYELQDTNCIASYTKDNSSSASHEWFDFGHMKLSLQDITTSEYGDDSHGTIEFNLMLNDIIFHNLRDVAYLTYWFEAYSLKLQCSSGVIAHMLYSYTVKADLELSLQLTVLAPYAPVHVQFEIHGKGWDDVSMIKYDTSFDIEQSKSKHNILHQFLNIESSFTELLQSFVAVVYFPEKLQKIFSPNQNLDYTFQNPFINMLPLEDLVIHIPSFNITTTMFGNKERFHFHSKPFNLTFNDNIHGISLKTDISWNCINYETKKLCDCNIFKSFSQLRELQKALNMTIDLEQTNFITSFLNKNHKLIAIQRDQVNLIDLLHSYTSKYHTSATSDRRKAIADQVIDPSISVGGKCVIANADKAYDSFVCSFTERGFLKLYLYVFDTTGMLGSFSSLTSWAVTKDTGYSKNSSDLSLIPTISPSTSQKYITCAPYSASNTNYARNNYANCTFVACDGDYFMITSCPDEFDWNSCYNNDVYLQLWDSLVRDVDDDYYSEGHLFEGYGSFHYRFEGKCRNYTIHEGCAGSNACSGQVIIKQGLVLGQIYAQYISNVNISSYLEKRQFNENIIKDAIASCLAIDTSSMTNFNSYALISDGDYTAGEIHLVYSIELYDIYLSCSTLENNIDKCISGGKLTDLIQYYSAKNNASSLYNAISNSRYYFDCRCSKQNDGSSSYKPPYASATQITLLWRGGYATYLNTTISTNYNNASLMYKYYKYEDLKVISEMTVTWDYFDNFPSGNISYDGYLNNYIYENEQAVANGTFIYDSQEYELFVYESSNIRNYEHSFIGLVKGRYGGSWNDWWASVDLSETYLNGEKQYDAIGYIGFYLIEQGHSPGVGEVSLMGLVNDSHSEELFYTNNYLLWDNNKILGYDRGIEINSELRVKKIIDWDTDLIFAFGHPLLSYGDQQYSISIYDYSNHQERIAAICYGSYGRALNSWWGTIDYSEARINEVKQGDAVAYLSFESKHHGSSGNVTVSTVVNNGIEVEQLSTNSSVHWRSPSNAWIETGAITAQSDFFIIDTINWNASGLLEYDHDKYAFKVDDYSSDGDQLFLAQGYGRYDSESVVSWWGSLDESVVFINAAKKAEAIGYVSYDSTYSVDTANIYLFALVNNEFKEELFYTNNSLQWSPGSSETWHNHNKNNVKIHGSGDIVVHSDLRVNATIDWDSDLLFNYGDKQYNITIEDHSSYDHKERFITYGYGRYGVDLNSWWGSIDYFEARLNEVKQGDALGYMRGEMKSLLSQVYFEVFGVINDNNDRVVLTIKDAIGWSDGRYSDRVIYGNVVSEVTFLNKVIYAIDTFVNIDQKGKVAHFNWFNSLYGKNKLNATIEASYLMKYGMITGINGIVVYDDKLLFKERSFWDYQSKNTISANFTQPTYKPTHNPSVTTSCYPSLTPSILPSCNPSTPPTVILSIVPSLMPSSEPSIYPSILPSQIPSKKPSLMPSKLPSCNPSIPSTVIQSIVPSLMPSSKPNTNPSISPSQIPSKKPSLMPSKLPSYNPTVVNAQSKQPTVSPSVSKSFVPSQQSSIVSSTVNLNKNPSSKPTLRPSYLSTLRPSIIPTLSSNPADISQIVFVTDQESINIQVSIVGNVESYVYRGVFLVDTLQSNVNLYSSNQIMNQNHFSLTINRTSSILIDNLIASSTYSLYCMTRSFEGISMALSVIKLYNHRIFHSECCKIVNIDMSVSNMYVKNINLDAIKITYNAAPSEYFLIMLSFYAINSNISSSNLPAINPQTFRMTNATSSQLTGSIFTNDEGQYLLNVTILGPSSNEYRIQFLGNIQLSVLNTNTPLPAPQMLQAIFANDGSFVSLSFDSATNKAGFSNAFPCIAILSFPGDTTAICNWISDDKITIYPKNNNNIAILNIRSNITLNVNTTQAKYNSDQLNYKARKYSSFQSIQVLAPQAPTLPVVVISMPQAISACNSLQINLLDSIGAAGREWKSISFQVHTENGISDAALKLQHILTQNYSLSPPSVIPPNSIQGGYIYSIQVTLCNFLAVCGSSVQSLSVKPSSYGLLPIVTILGQNKININRYKVLKLSANAFTLSCTRVVSYEHLAFSWTINGISVLSTSQNPAILSLPSYTLYSDILYTIEISVKSLVSSNTAIASVEVSVLPSNIVAVIAGAINKFVKIDQSFVIDASPSYDEDISPDQQVIFSYLWSCMQINPYSSDCSTAFTIPSSFYSNTQLSSHILIATAIGINTTSRFTVQVFDSSRSSMAYTDIIVTVDIDTPILDITTNLQSLEYINVDNSFALNGTLQITQPCIVKWTVDDPSVDFSYTALTTTAAYLLPEKDVIPFNLLLVPDSLPQRASLTFTLSCNNIQTSVTVTTNGSPIPGVFSISPMEGEALITIFSFLAKFWTDPDLPLLYIYNFDSRSSLNHLAIIITTQLSFTTSKLPMGVEELSFKLNCSLQVQDVFSSSTKAFALVTVKKAASTIVLQQSILSLINVNTGSLDETKNIISIVGTVLNGVNCSHAGNCASLRRNPCLKEDNLCSSCISGYVGDVGEQNTQCYAASDSYLNKHVKTCPDNCSNRGICKYVSVYTGNEVESCFYDDATCVTACACFDLYGGRSCEVSLSELLSNGLIRSKLITRLSNLTKLDDISSTNLKAWSSYLYSLAFNPFEISSNEDLSKLLDISNTTISNSLLVQISPTDSILGVLQAVDTIVATNNIISNNSFNIKYSSINTGYVLSVLDQFSDLVIQNMVYGQSNIVYYYDNFKLLNDLLYIPSSMSQFSVSTPQSEYERNLNESVSAIATFIPLAKTAMIVSLKIISVYPQLYKELDKNMIISNPLYLQLSSTQANVSHPSEYISHVSISFQNIQSVEIPKLTNFTSKCEGIASELTYECPGSGYIIQHKCNSSQVGMLISSCPIAEVICGTIDKYTSKVTPIKDCIATTTQNNTITVCDCKITNSYNKNNPKHSNKFSSLFNKAGIMNVIGIIKYPESDFLNTFQEADSFNRSNIYNKSKIVFLLIIVQIGIAFIYFVICYIESIRNLYKVHVTTASNTKNSLDDEDAIEFLKEYIAHIIPSIYNIDQSKFHNILFEINSHHRYFKMISKQSIYKKFLFLLQLLTFCFINMYLLALFYDIQDPSDDGSCVKYTTQITCLHRKTFFDNSETYCKWNENEISCKYADQQFNITATITILLLAAIITSLITFPLEGFIKTLYAPLKSEALKAKIGIQENNNSMFSNTLEKLSNFTTTAQQKTASLFDNIRKQFQEYFYKKSDKTVIANRYVPELFIDKHKETKQLPTSFSNKANSRIIHKIRKQLSLRRRIEALEVNHFDTNDFEITTIDKLLVSTKDRNTTNDKNAANSSTNTNLEWIKLYKDIINQRKKLIDSSGENAIETFDKQWGIEEKYINIGIFNIHKYKSISNIIQSAIQKDILYSSEKANELIENWQYYTEHHASFALMNLFILDLLGRNTPVAKIFQHKFELDFEQTNAVTYIQKIFAMTMLLAMNGFFIYYILLKAYVKGYTWQYHYLWSYIFRLLLDVIVFETIECIWLNIIVPLLVHKEVTQGILALEVAIESIYHELDTIDTHIQNTNIFLNAPNFLFASTKVAYKYPNLLESKIILSYNSHLPGEIYKTWPHYHLLDHRVVGYVNNNDNDFQAVVSEEMETIHNIFLRVGLAFLLMLKGLESMSIFYQRLVVKTIQQAVIAAIAFIIKVALSNWYALVLIIFLPMLFIGILIYYYREYFQNFSNSK